MSHIINKSGAEIDLFSSLSQRDIHRFSSIDDLFTFKKNYRREIEGLREQTISEVRAEIEKLSREIETLRSEYEHRHAGQAKLVCSEIAQVQVKLSLLAKGLASKIRGYFLRKKLSHLATNFYQLVNEPLLPLRDKIKYTTAQFTFLSSNQQEIITRRSAPFIAETERIVSVLSELAPLIYGAIGELKAIDLLRQLPDDYYVINDYQHSFHRPLYKKDEDDWIYSIQLDHVVIGPTGVFVIETKYWSPKSIASTNLFSPVKQLKRGSFALFVLINNRIRELRTFNNHWGSAQVSVANILLMMNATTNEQFQFIKILTEPNLLHHITSRPVTLTNEQVLCLVREVL